jgi:hypothetical protein
MPERVNAHYLRRWGRVVDCDLLQKKSALRVVAGKYPMTMSWLAVEPASVMFDAHPFAMRLSVANRL